MLNQALKLRRAQLILDKLKSGQRVPDRDVADVLGAARWSPLQSAIDEVRERRHHKFLIPAYIKSAAKRYTDKLALADRREALAEKSSAGAISTRKMRWKMIKQRLQFRDTAKKNHRIRAERAYESAIETLLEIIDELPEFVDYLDRQVVFEGEGCNVTPDPAGVPRMRNSRSRYVHARKPARQSIRGLEINALEEFIQYLRLGYE